MCIDKTLGYDDFLVFFPISFLWLIYKLTLFNQCIYCIFRAGESGEKLSPFALGNFRKSAGTKTLDKYLFLHTVCHHDMVPNQELEVWVISVRK